MALNYIFIAFFLIALIVAVIRTFQGELGVFTEIVNSTFDMAATGFEISLGLTGILCLWMGIMKIGEEGGSVKLMSRLVGPFFDKLFPEIPKDHPARGSMLLNFTANMLGLDNAATPAGLKAMDQLQDLNPEKDKATNAMIMFLVLNTSGLTIIPVTVMTYRAQQGASDPSDIFLPILISTFCASVVGLIAVAIYQKINLFNKVILAYLIGMTGIIAGIILYFQSLTPEELGRQSSLFSSVILYGIICAFIIMALQKKVNIYEAFIDGAKGGFQIAIKIIPYLVAILVAIGVFRASGALGYVEQGLAFFFGIFMENTEFTKGIPTALMKPLSGSGARGMMLESWDTYGVDSYVGKLTATLQGATDTTFYIIAVYFGAVGIKKTRYAVKAGLLADFGGIIAGIVIASVWFGSDTDQKLGVYGTAQEFAVVWENNDHEAMMDLMDDQCVLVDQAYDTLYTNDEDIVTNYFNLDYESSGGITVEKISQVEDQIFVKTAGITHSIISKKSYEFTISKDQITTIKYLGDF